MPDLLWEILDGYLNTNDYDYELNGWVSVEKEPNGYVIQFNPEEEWLPVQHFRIREE